MQLTRTPPLGFADTMSVQRGGHSAPMPRLSTVYYGATRTLYTTPHGSMVLLVCDHKYVIKRLPTVQTDRTQDLSAMARHEIDMLAVLRAQPHEGLIQALGWVPHKSSIDILLPRYAADLMDALLRVDRRGLSIAVACSIFRQVAVALAHLHTTVRLAHRDVSSENVLLAFDGTLDDVLAGTVPVRAVLTDWADAVRLDDGLACGRRGKRGYCAPEVYILGLPEEERPYDAMAADAWSSGAMLFMMLSGRPAYDIPEATDGFFVELCRGGSYHLHQCMLALPTTQPLPHDAVDRLHELHEGGAYRLIDQLLQVCPDHRATLSHIASSSDSWITTPTTMK